MVVVVVAVVLHYSDMKGLRLGLIFGVSWLSVVTVLLLYIAYALSEIMQLHNTLLSQMRQQKATIHDLQMQATSSKASQCAPCAPPKPCQCTPCAACPACSPPAICPACPDTSSLSTARAPCTPCTDPAGSHPAADAPVCQRPEKVHPVLRWLGVDIGKDFYHHMVTWQKKARASNTLIVEIGAGDGRQAATTARLGYRVISIDANRQNLALGQKIYQNMKDSNANSTDKIGNVTQIWSAVSNYSGSAKFWAMSGLCGFVRSSTWPNSSRLSTPTVEN